MHPLIYGRFRDKESGVPEEIGYCMRTLSASIYAADQVLVTLRRFVERNN